ncbi:hypothetical protein N656DRAFT_788562 [Canariomyces notabilis]|uniref:N-acetyltransferase domain-containing protein n=1 Tax=Canariomyces notabilis TaxID=2074819 RepID=A0AAN6TH49_9PEZI|nr:hypothetical protein N656DRAFT_788562 [Canariomyces arenarius]
MAMAPVPKPSKLDRYAPDLVARKTPRPDRYYRGSPPRSPPSSVITFHGSDAGTQNPALSNTVAKPEKDIRNAIALEHKFFMSDGKWHNWHQDDDAALARPNYFVPFVSMWSKGHPRFPEASSFHDHWGRHDHWNCDIDTDTGVFLPPVDYPYTMANESKLDPELDWRRQNWTSALMMRRRMDLRRNLRSNSRPQSQTHQEEDSRPELQQDPMLVHPSWFVTVDTPKLEQPEYMHYVPRIPCFLRPAKKSDMEGVHLIYNQEMQFGFQTLDFHFLSAEDFEKILNTTEELGFPFIVAVRGSARDLRLKGGNILHSPYRQITRDDSDRHGQKSGEILGFAFLSVWELGLTGSGTGSSRATAKLHVFVHHEHRRKKIGFSLMDMILTTVSDRFSSHSGYDFIDADDNPIYKSPKSHERKYFRIYVNYLVKHKHIAEGNKKLEEEQKGYDDDLVWVRKMLEDGLNFTEKVRFEAVHRTPKCREGPAFWLDSVVFEHTCQFDPRSLGEF